MTKRREKTILLIRGSVGVTLRLQILVTIYIKNITLYIFFVTILAR